jgi:hypothetical protein
MTHLSAFSSIRSISLSAQISTGTMLLLHLYHSYLLLEFFLYMHQMLSILLLSAYLFIMVANDLHTYFKSFEFLSYHFYQVQEFSRVNLCLLFDTVILNKYFIFLMLKFQIEFKKLSDLFDPFEQQVYL